MFTCLTNPGGCIASAIGSMLGAVPIWAWIIIALIIIGAVWKFAGWPGLIALAFGAGYFARDAVRMVRTYQDNRDHEPVENVTGADAEPPARRRPSKPKRKTLRDRFNDGLR